MAVVSAQEPFWIITELMVNGSLLDFLRSEQGKKLKFNVLIEMNSQVIIIRINILFNFELLVVCLNRLMSEYTNKDIEQFLFSFYWFCCSNIISALVLVLVRFKLDKTQYR